MDDWTRWMIMKATEQWVTWFWKTCGKGMRDAAKHESIRFYVLLNVYYHVMFLYLMQRLATLEAAAEPEQTAELEAEIAELGETISSIRLDPELASRIGKMVAGISKARGPFWAGMDLRQPYPQAHSARSGFASIAKRMAETNHIARISAVPDLSKYRHLAHEFKPAHETYDKINRMITATSALPKIIDTRVMDATKVNVLDSQLRKLAGFTAAASNDLDGGIDRYAVSPLNKFMNGMREVSSITSRLDVFVTDSNIIGGLASHHRSRPDSMNMDIERKPWRQSGNRLDTSHKESNDLRTQRNRKGPPPANG